MECKGETVSCVYKKPSFKHNLYQKTLTFLRICIYMVEGKENDITSETFLMRCKSITQNNLHVCESRLFPQPLISL